MYSSSKTFFYYFSYFYLIYMNGNKLRHLSLQCSSFSVCFEWKRLHKNDGSSDLPRSFCSSCRKRFSFFFLITVSLPSSSIFLLLLDYFLLTLHFSSTYDKKQDFLWQVSRLHKTEWYIGNWHIGIGLF